MTVPGFIDRAAHRERIRQQMLARFGADYQPPSGWDAFLAPDDPIRDIKCQQCGQMVAEVRPFGPNDESICEECAAKDMQTTTAKYLGLNPNA